MVILAMTPIITVPLMQDISIREGKTKMRRRIVAIITITVAIAVPFWGILAAAATFAVMVDSMLVILAAIVVGPCLSVGVLAGGVAWCEKHYARIVK